MICYEKKKQSNLASIQKLTIGLKKANISQSLIRNKMHLERLFPNNGFATKTYYYSPENPASLVEYKNLKSFQKNLFKP